MIKKTITVIASLLLCLQASAQIVFRSVEEVWRYADVHNITIRTAVFEKDKSALATRQSYGVLLPQVAANGTFTKNTLLPTTLIPAAIFGGKGDSYVPVQFGLKYIYFGGITAQMDLVNLQSWFNVQMAKNTEAYNEANVANTRKNIYQQVATQYYAYLLMQEAERLALQSELIADSVLQSVSNRFNEGKENKANVDVAEINLNRARETAIGAKYQMLTAMNTLKALLGIPLADPVSIQSVLQKDVAGAEASFEPDPQINLACMQTQISLSQYKAAKSAFLPTLGVLYSTTTQKNENEFHPFASSAPWYPTQYYALRASWTIFNGGARWYQTKRSKLSYDESMAQYEDIKNQSAIYDENLRLSYQKAIEVMSKAELVMHLSFDNYLHTTNRYNEGVETLVNRLNAFSDYIGYQNRYLVSLSEMLVQLYQIKIRQQPF